MATLRDRFLSIETTERGPYFRGYCGEHETIHEGIVQLAGNGISGKLFILFIHQLDSQLL